MSLTVSLPVVSPIRWRAAVVLAAALVAPAWGAVDPAFTPQATLRAFADQAELLAWFEPFAAERRRRDETRRQAAHEAFRRQEAAQLAWEAANPGKTWKPQVLMAQAVMARAALPPAAAMSTSSAEEAITNNQVAGVDEGGIVKRHGQHLVILRRGRLFTVAVGPGELRPVAAVDAFGPDTSPSGAWYDEMLIAGDTIAVIGYSYQRGGTEIGLFRIDAQGGLAYRATYNLRSADYYSSRNYASRLVDGRLVLYAPVPISLHHRDPLARLPALRRWSPGAQPDDFRSITPATRIYRTDEPLDAQTGGVTLHSIVSCDLLQEEPRCESSGVLGGWSRVFHVSGRAVYVWASQPRRGQAPGSALFRLPLDGGAPSMLKTAGSPIDQFSFLEQADGRLNVLVRSDGTGDAMWQAERQRTGSAMALLQVRVRDFGDGQDAAPSEAYLPLPAPPQGSLQNRYVGRHLLYGAGDGWYRPGQRQGGPLHVVGLDDGTVQALTLPHGVDRIEALGSGALAIGAEGKDLVFTSLRLGPLTSVAASYRQPDASQGETRSHGFFYKAESANEGVVGLPLRGGGQAGYRQLRSGSAAMLYLRNRDLRLTEIGTLEASVEGRVDDQCKASCVDWYGNARPLFMGDRVFALLGYELVEGRILRERPGQPQRVVELRRVNFAPLGRIDPR